MSGCRAVLSGTGSTRACGRRTAAAGEYWNVVNYSDGANTNDGLVNPDRTVQPEINEVKKVFQNFNVKNVDVNEGAFTVTNDNYFISSDGVALHWSIAENGSGIVAGVIDDLDIAPRSAGVC